MSFRLTRTVSISEEGYRLLEQTSHMTGLPMGQLCHVAVQRAFDPKRNPDIATARKNIAKAIGAQS